MRTTNYLSVEDGIRMQRTEHLLILAQAIDVSTRVFVHEPLAPYQEKMREELGRLAKDLWS